MKNSETLARLRGNGKPAKAAPLSKLARAISSEHKAVGDSFKAGMQHAIAAGRLLIEAKERLGHGEWLPWVEKHRGFNRFTAAAYMRLASNVQRVAHLSVREGLKLLAAGEESVHFSSDSAQWHTPSEVAQRVAQALGGIELDPCSDLKRNVTAEKHFTQDDDGLSREWFGRVYMNPPYGAEITAWVEKLCHQYALGNVTEAIALVPARTDTEWWRMFRDYAICFVDGRLKFSGHDNSAPFPSALVYLGKNIDGFGRAFEGIGSVWTRRRNPE